MFYRLAVLALVIVATSWGQAIGDPVTRPSTSLLSLILEIEQGDNTGTFDPVDTTARFDDSGDINFTFADGGAGGPDVVTATVRADSVALTTDTTGNYVADISNGVGLNFTGGGSEGATVTGNLYYGYTLASNPALSATLCAFNVEAGMGGFLCEGTAGNAFEHVWAFPSNADSVDTTNYIAAGNSSGDALGVASDSVALGTDTTGNYLETGSNTFSIGTLVTGAGDNKDIAAYLVYTNTLASNPALGASTCVLSSEGGGSGGFLCEGSTANTNEQLYLFPSSDAADTTNYIALADSAGAALTGDSATSFFSTGTLENARLSNGVRDVTKNITLETPTTSETGDIHITFPAACTMQRIWCSTNTGTATINLDERTEASPDATGTSVATSNIICDTNTEATTVFSNAGIAADVPVALLITATASSPGWLRVHARCRLD